METIINKKRLYLRGIAAFLLVLFCIQYIPIESRAGVSYVKVAASIFSFIVLFLLHITKVSRAAILCILYFTSVFISVHLHAPIRYATIIYLLSYLVLFTTFYNLVYIEQVFTKEFFTKLIKNLLITYTIVLVIQQAFIIVGIKQFPLINLVQVLNRGIGANSISYEPSTTARIMAVLFLAIIRMYELKYNRAIKIIDIYTEDKWMLIGVFWSMVTMGSGTAFIALGILSIYFIKRQYALTAVSILVILYFCIPYIDYEPIQRAYKTINAFLTMDTQNVIRADGSAADRVVPLMNTITKLNLYDFETWFGHGTDYLKDIALRKSEEATVGRIGEFGLISFIIMQATIYKCVIRRFFSIETIMWIGLFNMTFANVAFVWGAIMVFTCVRYLSIQQENEYSKKMDNCI